MRELAIVICVAASILGLVTGLITVRRHEHLWQLTSIQQFGGAILTALLVAMLATFSDGLAVTVMVFGLTFALFSIYALHVKSGLTPR